MRKILGALLFLFLCLHPLAAAALDVGDKAPDFDLPSTQGGKLKLSSFLGKKNVLLESYVLEFTKT
jgi:peroxiredoxin